MQGPVAQQLQTFAGQPIHAIPGRAAQAYIQTQVSSRSALELVVMLEKN